MHTYDMMNTYHRLSNQHSYHNMTFVYHGAEHTYRLYVKRNKQKQKNKGAGKEAHYK